MSILIKGMEMPENCVDCRFCDNDAMCVILGEDLFDYVQAEVADHIRYLPDDWKCDTCPLVEVPTPHGRLIDADELPLHDEFILDGMAIDVVFNSEIEQAPTIIEAEE